MIEEKLKILLESGTITQRAHDCGRETAAWLLDKKIIGDMDEADMFLTHLVMAITRQERVEPVDGLSEEMWAGVTSEAVYPKAKALWPQTPAAGSVRLGETEVRFCIMHLCVLLGLE